MGFSNYPQGLSSQIPGGINVSRASKPLEMLASVSAWRSQDSAGAVPAGTGDFVGLQLLRAFSLLGPRVLNELCWVKALELGVK